MALYGCIGHLQWYTHPGSYSPIGAECLHWSLFGIYITPVNIVSSTILSYPIVLSYYPILPNYIPILYCYTLYCTQTLTPDALHGDIILRVWWNHLDDLLDFTSSSLGIDL